MTPPFGHDLAEIQTLEFLQDHGQKGAGKITVKVWITVCGMSGLLASLLGQWRSGARNGAEVALHAYVDESMRIRADGSDVFVLAAALIPAGECEEIREEMRQLLLRGQRQLHWRLEGSVRRRKIVKQIASLDVQHRVVVGSPLPPRRQERARRVCLERLLWELDRESVESVWLEAFPDTK
ncbi:MAG: DUF3800 domain-containing protein [Streptosporangiales bacterium]|nr:DUF3800 domain-containing protein [Streptosporangiales bacterium]